MIRTKIPRRLPESFFPEDLDVGLRRRYALVHVVCLVAVVNLFPMGVVAHCQGNHTVGFIDHLVGALLAATLVFVRRGGSLDTATYAGIALGGALFLYLLMTGGVQGTGHLWFFTYPLFACFLLGSRHGALASLLLLVPTGLFFVLDTRSVAGLHDYSTQFAVRFFPAYLVVLAYSFAFERLRESAHGRVSAQNARLAQVVVALREKEHALEEAQGRLEQRVRERTVDLRRANEALRRSHTRFTTVLDSLPANVYVADLETHEILFANRCMQEALGADLVGRRCWETIRGEAAPCSTCTNPQLVDENGTPGDVVTWEGWNPVTKRWYLYHDRAVRWEAGRMVRLQVGTDITKRRTAEEENARLQQELLQAQKMEAIGTLAGGVAHDLNNILSGVVGFPDLILMELPEDSPLRRPITAVRHSGEKCARIVQDMLTLARRGVARSERVSVAEIMEQYFESPEYERLLEQYAGVNVEYCSVADRATYVSGSAHHLSKTLMNLVVNALEAMPEGGRVQVETIRREVERPIRGVTTIPRGEYVVLRVSDTGIGLPPDRSHRIFEPFYTTKAMGRSGTGLGMAVVWATVQDHQGFVDVRSREGEGTTFELYFPALVEAGSNERKPEALSALRGRGERILVVDDMKEQRDLALMILNRLGYAADAVASGEEALAYLGANRPDLLILDMIMEGGIDGLETYRRALAIRPGQRAIVVSGYAESERVAEALRLGAGGFLGKPYLVQDLGATIRRALDTDPAVTPRAIERAATPVLSNSS